MKLLIALLLISLTLPAHGMSPMMLLAGAKKYTSYSFESGVITNWSESIGVDAVNLGAGAYHGTWVEQIASGAFTYLTFTGTVQTGTVSGRVKGSGAAGGSIALQKNGSTCASTTLTTSWQELSCSVTAGDAVRFEINLQTPSTAPDAYIDYVVLTRQ